MVDQLPKSQKKPRIVGQFIRDRRESLNLSQKALGQLFEPPVTTQFISNVERGVTPLPPVHVPTLCKALQVKEDDLMMLLEREYANKLSGKLGHNDPNDPLASLIDQIRKGFASSSEEQRSAFKEACRQILKIEIS